jgi:hypothetical protein
MVKLYNFIYLFNLLEYCYFILKKKKTFYLIASTLVLMKIMQQTCKIESTTLLWKYELYYGLIIYIHTTQRQPEIFQHSLHEY